MRRRSVNAKSDGLHAPIAAGTIQLRLKSRRNGAAWGQLPAHKRQEILQSMTEGFPAHYQQILERYYRRLAEEKPASEAAEEAVPAATPAASAAPAPSGQRSAP